MLNNPFHPIQFLAQGVFHSDHFVRTKCFVLYYSTQKKNPSVQTRHPILQACLCLISTKPVLRLWSAELDGLLEGLGLHLRSGLELGELFTVKNCIEQILALLSLNWRFIFYRWVSMQQILVHRRIAQPVGSCLNAVDDAYSFKHSLGIVCYSHVVFGHLNYTRIVSDPWLDDS